jgi:aminocarboxymuconate-semialdehyde decarboxylase
MVERLRPKLLDTDVRWVDMQEMGVDMQVLSPTPAQYHYWAEPSLAEDIVGLQNEHIAALCRRRPDQFVGLGTVALQHPERAAAQLETCITKLGLKGVEISTQINDIDLGDPRLDVFWQRAETLGAVIFIHPNGSTTLSTRIAPHYMLNTIGQPIETTIALSSMIFGGTLDRFPKLKICAAHGGGYLTHYIGRSDHARAVRPEAKIPKRKPSEYLREIYVDSLVYTPQQVRHLVATVGPTQIVVGTDYPADMGDYGIHSLLNAALGDDKVTIAAVAGRNAAKLLGIPLPGTLTP